MIQERLAALRAEMKKREIDYYVIPTADFHESEYVGDYFKARMYMTGFTGSAGVAVVGTEKAYLWTDGRYFIQAEQQLAGSTVELCRMGTEGVPTVDEFLQEHLPEGGCIGFDGRVMNAAAAACEKEIAESKNGRLYTTEDLVGLIWADRPAMPHTKCWVLEEAYSGESAASKIARVRSVMEEKKADVHLLTCLYDIAWLLNVRADDIAHVPVVLSFLALTKEECIWFVQEEALDDTVQRAMADAGVTIKPYEEIYAYAAQIPAGQTVLLNRGIVNYGIYGNLDKEVQILDDENPTELMKAIKNETELRNTRIAHLKDGVAVTKFMYWLKTNIGKEKITEISASDYLEKLRRQQENIVDLSFTTICAYGANAAMMHYSATEESNAELQPKGFLLVDSGGHYMEGTTDITRTFVLGEITEEERKLFTTVCRSNLNLASAKFLYGCRGVNLDILCRGPLWDLGIDYRCGTGHGVGHLLNVHEGPNGFRWKIVPERKDSGVLEAGMITTDEPGVYEEGRFGIRTENELICRLDEKNEYGQFMSFENITYAPIDLDAIDPEEMTKTERERLNNYHKMVYEKLSPYMTEEENEWLKTYTREI